MLDELGLNLLSELLGALILALLGASTYFVVFFAERQRILQFFGISSELPRICIYLSRIEVGPGGAEIYEPGVRQYTVTYISKIEYDGALIIRNKLRTRLLARFPKRFLDWLEQQHISLIAIDPEIESSPAFENSIPYDNLVVFGSTVYNLATKRYMEHPSCLFSFITTDTGDPGIVIRSGGLKDVEIPGRASGRELAIIQRVKDEEHGNTVFICAGLGQSATFGSARYLIDNWRKLHRQYGSRDFGVCLAFPLQPPDSGHVMHPVVVYRSQ
jgi:hypothetical protein